MILTENELRQAQKIMLIILKKFDSFCKTHQLSYFLHAGTLLGAVRHKGFIPWDDDVDVGMLRDDYEKFCKLFQTEQDDLILQNYDTDEGFGFPYSKLILNNTKWIEAFAKDSDRKYNGIFLDIFVFDKISADKKEQKKLFHKNKLLRLLMLSKQNYSLSFNDTFRSVVYKIICFFSKFVSAKKIQKKHLELCLKHSYLANDCLVTNFGGDFYENINPERYYKDLIKCKFEDSEFYIPKEYDEILRKSYGNYMIPPQNPIYKHEIVEYNFGPYLQV